MFSRSGRAQCFGPPFDLGEKELVVGFRTSSETIMFHRQPGSFGTIGWLPRGTGEDRNWHHPIFSRCKSVSNGRSFAELQPGEYCCRLIISFPTVSNYADQQWMGQPTSLGRMTSWRGRQSSQTVWPVASGGIKRTISSSCFDQKTCGGDGRQSSSWIRIW